MKSSVEVQPAEHRPPLTRGDSAMVDCHPIIPDERAPSSMSITANLSEFLGPHAGADWLNQSSPQSANDLHRTSISENIEGFLYSRLLIAVCVLGILGNVLNLLVLTRKGLQKTMDRMERSVHTGLVCLAISDLIFCLLLLPHAWLERKAFFFLSRSFALLYNLYSEGFINIFIMTSTWLTVIMATSRYLAICHPLRAREVIGMTFARVSVAVVFLFCVLCNLPKFWRENIERMDCSEGIKVYYRGQGFLQLNPMVNKAYLWFYFCVAIFIPILLLGFCNVHLIKALKQSGELRRRYNPAAIHVEGAHRFTLTLVVIVVTYVVLVTPAELLNFARQVAIDDTSRADSHNVLVAIANVLQAVNFAFNYVLYCVVNVHFRKTMRGIICNKIKGAPTEAPTSNRSRYDSLTATTGLLVLNPRNNVATTEV